MKRNWTTIFITNWMIASLLCPSGLVAARQSGAPQQRKQSADPPAAGSGSAPSQTAPTGQAGQSAAPPPAAEEFIEVERDTPFGKERFRVPKNSVNAPAQGPASTPQAVQPQGPAAAPQPGPAALSQSGQQPGAPPPAPAAQSPVPPSPAPSPSASPAPEPDTAAVPIALHLDNANLLQVIGIIAAELKMNYVVDPAVRGTVNINTLGDLRRGDLFPLLQMILRINGATAVQTGNFFRIVPLKDVQRMPLDPLYNAEADALPSDDRMVMDIIPLRYVSAPDMTKILTPFLSEGGHLFSQDAANILLITDSSRSMKRLLELVGMFDTDAFTNQRARLYPIKNSQAAKTAEELGTIFAAYGMSEKSSSVRFVAIERINSVLVVTPNASVYPEVEKWLAKLDQPQQESGIKNFVYKVENAKAADLVAVLGPLLGASYSSPAAGAPRPATPPPGGGLTPQSPAVSTQGLTPMVGAITPGGSQIRIVADPINNQVLIQCTAQEYEQIRQTLKDMDIIPRQVMIEAKVYEVDLTGALSGGVTAYLQNASNPTNPVPTNKLLSGFDGTTLSGSVGSLIGKTRLLTAFLSAAEQRSQARVISAPSIVAIDNLTASINVGTQIPTLTSQAASGVQVSGGTLFSQTIQNVDTGVILSITPRINPSGLVNLQINQEVSSPVTTTTSSIQSPSIEQRSIQTQVVVQNGETIALGGIIQENRSIAKNRIPLLGDIPYLGALFGSTSITSQRTELIVLITPTVIRTLSEAQSATTEFRDKLRDLRSILEEEEMRAREQKAANERKAESKE